jgi:hypothetical protein
MCLDSYFVGDDCQIRTLFLLFTLKIYESYMLIVALAPILFLWEEEWGNKLLFQSMHVTAN